MNVIWSPFAQHQRKEAAKYIRRKFGSKATKKFHQNIVQWISLIMGNPGIGQKEPLLQGRKRDYRSIVISRQNKLVYYVAGDTLPGNDTLRGLAYNAEFYLAKVDIADREPRADEERMMQGIAWLVEQGVDIISSSVAYTVFDDFRDYTPQMLDGKSSRLSRFVDSVLAAHPDLIFVQSAGNKGKEDWKYICFPGDVREVITVGSCANADGTIHYSRSSMGREESGYIKPDVVTEPSPIGTSFSTPTITGLCAALLEWKRMDRKTLIQLLHRSGTKADAPDYKLGYGRPQTEKLVEMLK